MIEFAIAEKILVSLLTLQYDKINKITGKGLKARTLDSQLHYWTIKHKDHCSLFIPFSQKVALWKASNDAPWYL